VREVIFRSRTYGDEASESIRRFNNRLMPNITQLVTGRIDWPVGPNSDRAIERIMATRQESDGTRTLTTLLGMWKSLPHVDSHPLWIHIHPYHGRDLSHHPYPFHIPECVVVCSDFEP
jgi:hypothetical protein